MRALLMFVGGAALLAAVAVWLMSRDQPFAAARDPQTDDAYVDGDLTPIAAHEQGYLATLPVDDNQPVQAGQLIATLDDSDYRASLAQAEAQVQAAQAALAALDERTRAAGDQVVQARTNLDAARARLISTGPEARRQQALRGTDVGLGRQRDSAVAAAQVTAANIARAQAALESAGTQLALLAAQRREATAALAGRQAQARLAQIALGWTRITSPISGTLGQRQVRVGSLLLPGSVVVSATPLDTVWVSANFTERQIRDIHPGEPARLRLDAFPGEALDGHVAGLEPATGSALATVPADNATGNFTKVVARLRVKVAIDWRGSRLRGLARPGMSAVALVRTRADSGSEQVARPQADAP